MQVQSLCDFLFLFYLVVLFFCFFFRVIKNILCVQILKKNINTNRQTKKKEKEININNSTNKYRDIKKKKGRFCFFFLSSRYLQDEAIKVECGDPTTRQIYLFATERMRHSFHAQMLLVDEYLSVHRFSSSLWFSF